nr:hypothetical protein CFP56_31905 [Quercus suber]
MDHISMHIEGTESSKKGETQRSNLVPPPNHKQRAPQQHTEPQTSPYLTREDVVAILFEARKAESSAYIDRRPHYPKEMARKPCATNYTPLIFPKYDGMIRNAREHIRRYIDALTAHSHDHELRLRELSKSLEEELYSILIARVKDDVVVLPECKHEPTKEEKRGALYCRYYKRSDHHTVDCYTLRNIFYEKAAKGDLVIKNGKRTDKRMHRPEVAMTFFIGCEDPMEEEAGSVASSSFAPPPLQDEKMALRIQQDDKVHSFLEGIGLRPFVRKEAAQALT